MAIHNGPRNYITERFDYQTRENKHLPAEQIIVAMTWASSYSRGGGRSFPFPNNRKRECNKKILGEGQRSRWFEINRTIDGSMARRSWFDSRILIRLVGPSKRLETREILLLQKSVPSVLLLDLNMLLPVGQRISYVSWWPYRSPFLPHAKLSAAIFREKIRITFASLLWKLPRLFSYNTYK